MATYIPSTYLLRTQLRCRRFAAYKMRLSLDRYSPKLLCVSVCGCVCVRVCVCVRAACVRVCLSLYVTMHRPTQGKQRACSLKCGCDEAFI